MGSMAHHFLLATTAAALCLVLAATGREIPAEYSGGGGGPMECWNALYELSSCTNEIVLFFLNGETKLGPHCCTAVHVITANCWPAMLTSLGLTSDEANVLRGYCHSSSPAPSPDFTF